MDDHNKAHHCRTHDDSFSATKYQDLQIFQAYATELNRLFQSCNSSTVWIGAMKFPHEVRVPADIAGSGPGLAYSCSPNIYPEIFNFEILANWTFETGVVDGVAPRQRAAYTCAGEPYQLA